MQTLLTHEDLKELQGKNILCDFIVETLSVWIDYASLKHVVQRELGYMML